MRRLTIGVSSIAIVLAFVIPIGAAEPTTQPHVAAENARLRARVAELEKQMQELRDQLAGKPPAVPRPFSLVPPASPVVPRDWSVRKFNGITWYMVPLTDDERDTVQAPPAAPSTAGR